MSLNLKKHSSSIDTARNWTFKNLKVLEMGTGKESLHIILIRLVSFEINRLHSIGFRQMMTKEKIYEKIFLRVPLSHNIQKL